MKEGKKGKGDHLRNGIKYIENAEKTQDGEMVTYINCDEGTAYKEMLETKQYFDKTDGRQGYHIIISLKPGEGNPKLAHKIAGEFVDKYLQNEYEVVYATHDDRPHIHTHIIFNSINLNGKKYRYERGDWVRKIQPITNELTEKYGLSIMVNTQGNDTPYKMWMDEKEGKHTLRDTIKNDIGYVAGESFSLGDFILQMKDLGYEVELNNSKTDIKFKSPMAKRWVRASSLGEGYSLNEIYGRIEIPKGYTNRLKGARQRIKPFHKKLKYTKFQKQVWWYKKRMGLVVKKRKDFSNMSHFSVAKAQRRIDYISDNKLITIKQLEDIIKVLEKSSSECVTRRVAIYRAKKRYKAAFEKLEMYDLLKYDSQMYLEGDEYFKENHLRREKLKSEIETMANMSLTELQKKEVDYKNGLYEVRAELKEINSELKLCKDIENDYHKAQDEKRSQEQQQTESKKRGINLEL